MSTVGGVGIPKTTERYVVVVHYEARDPSATFFAIDDTARQAIAAAKGEEPDDDFVSFLRLPRWRRRSPRGVGSMQGWKMGRHVARTSKRLTSC
jgi:hypothetical protein